MPWSIAIFKPTWPVTSGDIPRDFSRQLLNTAHHSSSHISNIIHGTEFHCTGFLYMYITTAVFPYIYINQVIYQTWQTVSLHFKTQLLNRVEKRWTTNFEQLGNVLRRCGCTITKLISRHSIFPLLPVFKRTLIDNYCLEVTLQWDLKWQNSVTTQLHY